MSANRGIFEAFPQTNSPASQGGENPFSFAQEQAAGNPFSRVAEPENLFAHQANDHDSPFSTLPDVGSDRPIPEPGKPAKIPDRRPKSASDNPFQFAPDMSQQFGYDAPMVQAVPYEAPQQIPQLNAAAPNPFQKIDTPAPVQQTQWAPATAAPQDVVVQGHFAPNTPPPVQFQTAPPAHYAPAPEAHSYDTSVPLRQLELRAIFGVDREMNVEEILQRCRSLPGVKHVAAINSSEVASLENLKRSLGSLGFATGNMKLYCGSVPIEFVRDGNTMLAVQTDGGFAPGVQATLMIVARELEKMA